MARYIGLLPQVNAFEKISALLGYLTTTSQFEFQPARCNLARDINCKEPSPPLPTSKGKDLLWRSPLDPEAKVLGKRQAGFDIIGGEQAHQEQWLTPRYGKDNINGTYNLDEVARKPGCFLQWGRKAYWKSTNKDQLIRLSSRWKYPHPIALTGYRNKATKRAMFGGLVKA